MLKSRFGVVIGHFVIPMDVRRCKKISKVDVSYARIGLYIHRSLYKHITLGQIMFLTIHVGLHKLR